MTDRLDMTLMYAMHSALRRELEYIARITAGTDDDPRRILASAAGWATFKKALHVHHSTEDDALWPVMRQGRAGRPDDLALLAAMEAEHAAIDPLLAAIDTAVADPDTGPQRLGDLTDALATALRGHLKHEEDEGLALIDATLAPEQWQALGVEIGKRLGDDVQRYMPWVLEDAPPEVTARLLGQFPPPLLAAYRDQWQPAYAKLTVWP